LASRKMAIISPDANKPYKNPGEKHPCAAQY
jgi:hypothetical protein